MLQVDARNNSPADIANSVGVAANTVRNRMENLKATGILQGYQPIIDYEQAGYQLRVKFICTVPVSKRADIADNAMEVNGVVQVVERLSGKSNLSIESIGNDSDDITNIATQLEDLGCDIEEEWFIKNSRIRPFNHFGVEQAQED